MQDLMPPINTPDSAFHDGDPTTGQLGTIVTALWLNNVQSATRDVQLEIKNVLAKAGIQPDPKKTNQLAEAISQIIGSGNYASTAYVDNGLNKKFDKANISGQKGNDNDKVPSLNLFTTEIGKLAALGYSYSKIESDGRYQPKGNYAPAGDYATNKALTEGLSGKFDKNDVAQNAGSSLTKTMSQNEITNELRNHGIGGVLKEIVSENESGSYLSRAGSSDNPDSANGFAIFNLAASVHYKTQLAISYNTSVPTAYIRTIHGDKKNKWEQIAAIEAIEALKVEIDKKQDKGDFLLKNKPTANESMRIDSIDYPMLTFRQTESGDDFDIFTTPTRNAVVIRFRPKSGGEKRVTFPFSEIDNSVEISSHKTKKIYTGGEASVGQVFSFGENAIGKKVIVFHDGFAKVQALVTHETYKAYATTGAGSSIAVEVRQNSVVYSHNTGGGKVTEIWLVG
ncbi:hypothetical protein [Providencia sp. PROV200]|uniref:hypothetical protein n=1 Tax=Providencia sp. PROV200 TaxID=2936794 RepID=UPI003CF49267